MLLHVKGMQRHTLWDWQMSCCIKCGWGIYTHSSCVSIQQNLLYLPLLYSSQGAKAFTHLLYQHHHLAPHTQAHACTFSEAHSHVAVSPNPTVNSVFALLFSVPSTGLTCES